MRYRWVHRVCKPCATSLRVMGRLPLEAAIQVQCGMRVPTCYPGIVLFRGVEMPPPQSKWSEVAVPPGAVTIDWGRVRCRLDRLERPTNLEPFSKEQIWELPRGTKTRYTYALCGIGVSGFYPVSSEGTAFVQAKALLGRVFRRPDPNGPNAGGGKPLSGVWEKAWEFVDLLLPGLVAKMMAAEEWLATMPARRKLVLSQALTRLRRVGWKKGYANFQAFVKTEFLPGVEKKSWGLEPIKEMMDRLIQGPKDETHCIAGPYLKPLTHDLKRVWDLDGPLFYASAVPEKLHEFLQKLLRNSILNGTCDFSMFDSTHSEDTFEFMKRLYRRAGIHDPLFWKVFTVWQRPRGRIGPLKYEAPTMNASGRDDTSLLNAVLNGVCTVLSIAAAIHECSVLDLTEVMVRATLSRLVLGVAGDDSIWTLSGVEGSEVPALEARVADGIRSFGFIPTMKVSNRVEDMVFLGMRPYPVNGNWYWGKTIGRAIYKMGWAQLRGKKDLLAHITGVASMHAKCSPHVPILADMAQKIVELRSGCRATPVAVDSNKPWEWTREGNPPYAQDTLEYVARCYSTHSRTVTAADIKRVIALIRGISRIPCVLDDPTGILELMGLCDDL